MELFSKIGLGEKYLKSALVDSCLLCRNWLWKPDYCCAHCRKIFEEAPLYYRQEQGLDIFSLFQFVPPMDKLIRFGKKEEDRGFFSQLTEVAARKFAQECLWPVEAVIPMPPRVPGKKDHAYFIAEGAARFFRAPVCTQFLKRPVEKVSQKERSQKERHKIKLEKASYDMAEVEMEGLVLFVDDVVTTGATLIQAWTLLGKPPAIALTLASTPLWMNLQ